MAPAVFYRAEVVGWCRVRPRPAVWIQLSRQGRVATSRPGGVGEGGERRAISHEMSGPSIGERRGAPADGRPVQRGRAIDRHRGAGEGAIEEGGCD